MSVSFAKCAITTETITNPNPITITTSSVDRIMTKAEKQVYFVVMARHFRSYYANENDRHRANVGSYLEKKHVVCRKYSGILPR